jgi:hypothetical protein
MCTSHERCNDFEHPSNLLTFLTFILNKIKHTKLKNNFKCSNQRFEKAVTDPNIVSQHEKSKKKTKWEHHDTLTPSVAPWQKRTSHAPQHEHISRKRSGKDLKTHT